MLTSQTAAQLLKRASELDAVRKSGSEIAELRAAAIEAGISMKAFDDALAEMQAQEVAPPQPLTRVEADPGRRLNRWGLRLSAALVAALISGAFIVPRVVSTARVADVVEQSIPLRCMPTEQALDLIRPLLGPSGTVSTPSSGSPRTLRIRATPEEMARIRAVLDEQDRTGSAACALPATPPPR